MTLTNTLVAGEAWNRDEDTPQVYVPGEILTRYVLMALRDVMPRRVDGAWYADVPRFPGVWATEASPKECLDTLADVLREWLILKIADDDRDIPVIDEIDLNVL